MRFRRTTEQVVKARYVFFVFSYADGAFRKFRNCAFIDASICQQLQRTSIQRLLIYTECEG
jgi:hypothetical protein